MQRNLRLIAVAVWLAASLQSPANAAEPRVDTRQLNFKAADGWTIEATSYRPVGAARVPVLIAAPGGGWRLLSSNAYRHWGPYLAQRGYALLAIRYRLATKGPTFPMAALDVRTAVQYVRHNAASLGIDPARIGLIGDSAGAHLAALVALSGEELLGRSPVTDTNAYAGASAQVKVVVGIYGIYDLLAHWNHDQLFRPRSQIVEQFLGVSPLDDRRTYFDASPISYATTQRPGTRFLLVYGTDDEIVDASSQSKAFLTALRMANILARQVVIPGAGHFWIDDPIDEAASHTAHLAPRLLRFLEEHL
jgi:acetyl esterase/lipase